MGHQNIAILSIGAKIDKQSIQKAMNQVNESMKDIELDLNGSSFKGELVKQYLDAMDALKKKSKQINLSGFQGKFLEELFKSSDIESANKALESYVSTIENLISLTKSSGYKQNMFDNLSSKNLEDLINKHKELIDKRKELESLGKSGNEKEIKAREIESRSINELLKNYEELDDYKKSRKDATSNNKINDIKKEIGLNKELSKEQEEEVVRYSKLLSLYKEMANADNKPEKGTVERIKYNKELLAIVTEIHSTEKKLGEFSSKSSAYRTKLSNESEKNVYKDINSVDVFSSRYVDQYVTAYINRLKNTLTEQIASLDAVFVEALNKMTVKGAERAEKISEKGTGGKSSGSGTGTGTGDSIKKYTEDVKDLDVALQKIKETLSAKAFKGGTFNKDHTDSIKDLIGYTQQYIELYKKKNNIESLSDDEIEGILRNDLKLSNIAVNRFFGKGTGITDDIKQDFEKLKQSIIEANRAKEEFTDGSGTGSGTGGGSGFVQSKEDAEALLETLTRIKEVLGTLDQKFQNLGNLSDNEYSKQLLEEKEELKDTFSTLVTHIQDELQDAFSTFAEKLNKIDDRTWDFPNLRSSLLDVVEQFKNSLGTVDFSPNQFDEVYKILKGWNDASNVFAKSKMEDSERAAFIGRKSGDVSNSYLFDKEAGFDGKLFDEFIKVNTNLKGKFKEVYDTWVHSHPFRETTDGHKNIGSDIGFSKGDLGAYINKVFEKGISNMMVVNNGKYSNIDWTGIVDKKVIERVREILSKSDIYDSNGGIKNELFRTTDGLHDLDKKSELIRSEFVRAMKEAGIEDAESRYTTGNIEDLKVDMSELATEGKNVKNESEELLIVLNRIAEVLNEINQNGFKFTQDLGSNENLERLQKELDETKEKLNNITKEAKETGEGIQKIVYHYGNLTDLGKEKGEKFSQMISSYHSGIRDGNEPWGAMGTGTYITSNSDNFKDINKEALKSFYSIDISKLKMYETETTEHAKALFEYLTKLQQYCISFASGYNYQNTFDISKISSKDLFEQYKSVFKEVTLDFNEFETFINQMFDVVKKAGIKSDGTMSPKANITVGKDSISTRFMKMLGYDGINNAGTDLDGIQHGSVIFDLDKSNIVSRVDNLNDVVKQTISDENISIQLSPTLINNFIGEVQDLINALTDHPEIELSPKLIEGFVNKAQDLVDDLTKISGVDVSLDPKLSSSLKLEDVDFENENTQIRSLIISLQTVKELIGKKNAAFVQEGKIVNSVIPEETNKIGKLVSALNNVLKKVQDISTAINSIDFSNFKIPDDFTKEEKDEVRKKIDEINDRRNAEKENKSKKQRQYEKKTVGDDATSKDPIKADKRHNSVKAATESLINSLTDNGGELKGFTAFYDSQNRLVKTTFKEMAEVVDEFGNKAYKSNDWTIKYNDKDEIAYSSHIENYDFDKADKEEQRNINDLLKDQRDKLEEIYKVREQISNLDPEKDSREIESLKKQEGSRQEELRQINIQLEQYDELYDKEKQLLELRKISSSYTEKIDRNKSRKEDDDYNKEQKSTYAELNTLLDKHHKIQLQIIKDGENASNEDLKEEKRLLEEINKLEQQINDRGLSDPSLDKIVTDKKNDHSRIENNTRRKKARKDNEALSDQDVAVSDDLKRVNDLYKEQLDLLSSIKILQNKIDSGELNDEDAANAQKLISTYKEKLLINQKKYNNELSEEYEKTDDILALLEKIRKNQELYSISADKDLDLSNFDLDLISGSDKSLNNVNAILSALDKTKKEMSDLSHMGSTDIFTEAFKDGEVKVSELNDQLTSGKITLKEYNSKIKELQTGLKKKINTIAFIDKGDIETANRLMVEYMNEISGGKAKIIGFNKEIGRLTFSFEDQNDQLQKVTLSVNKTKDAIDRTFGSPQKSFTWLEEFFNGLPKKMADLGRYLMTFVGFHEFINMIRNGLRYVTEFDTAMTELIKVSNDTEKALRAFGDESFRIADQVASTGTEITQAAADWSRLGYSIKEASELAKNSAIYVNVGDGVDVETATSDMVSAMKAFDIQAEDSMKIIDRYNAVANQYAISAGGIGAAMARSSSALAMANNSIDQSVAMAAAMNEIIQDEELVGQTLKTLSLRLRGAKTEIEEAGESTEGMADSTSKLREKVLALTNVNGKGGFDIMLNDDEFKSTYDIVKGIAEAWEDISDVNQAALLELLAGKNRAQGMAALLTNFGQAEKALQTSLESEGSALRENEKYMDSIQGKINQVQNSWQELWTTGIDDELVKDVLDLAKGLLDIANNAGLVKTAMAGLGAIFGTVIGYKTKDSGGRARNFVVIRKLITHRSLIKVY